MFNWFKKREPNDHTAFTDLEIVIALTIGSVMMLLVCVAIGVGIVTIIHELRH